MNQQSECPFAAPHRPLAAASRPTERRIRRRTLHPAGIAPALLLVLLIGIAGPGLTRANQDSADRVSAGSQASPRHPGSVFPTIEAAALEALAHAHETATPRDRGRLRLGTIYRVAGGYSYAEPIRSKGTVWSTRSPILRFRLRPIDVASYVVHPSSGANALDRANEKPNHHQRRVVDRLDSRNRPLYILTPSLRVMRYAERELSQVASALESAGAAGQERILLSDSTRNRERASR